jgi:hypothetical protein
MLDASDENNRTKALESTVPQPVGRETRSCLARAGLLLRNQFCYFRTDLNC